MKLIDNKQLADRLGIPELAILQLRARDPSALPTPFSVNPLLWREESVDPWIEQRTSSVTRKRRAKLALVALAVTALAVAASMLWPTTARADWVGEWFDQSTSVSAGGYQNQQRGFYSAGGFSGRYRMTNDFLVTASPPRLEVGCGGIDLFGGGFTYLDPEYLVEKFERIIQAAPAFAFDLAMTQYCQVCKDSMNTLTAITDQLNSIQLNDCRMSKRLVTAVAEDKNVARELWAEAAGNFSVSEALKKNPQDFQGQVRASNGAAPDDTQSTLADCPDLFRRIFVNGSVIQNAAAEAGLAAFAPVMRGLIGDARVTYNSAQRLYQVETFGFCPSNALVQPDSFVTGTVDQMSAMGACSSSGMAPVIDTVHDQLTNISTKLRTPGGAAGLTPEERAFVNRSAFPLLTLLSNAAAQGNSEAMVEILAEPVAFATAHRMLNDLWEVMRFVIHKANQVSSNQFGPPSAGPARCDVAFVDDAVQHFKRLEPRVAGFAGGAREAWLSKMTEYQTTLAVTKGYAEDYRRQVNRQTLGQR
ncbi:MAG: conjugal transfer protein TraH [Gammaproteobacteria bacterium]|nr:conjugal transfer protein TraH [Gammaproteobacteria bacterium]